MKLSKDQQVQIAQALYIVNRHAKTAQDKKPLYQLKQNVVNKLLHQKYSKKEGLHFSENPKNSKQHSTTLVSFANYLFHIPSSADDKLLPHLGKLDFTYQNPDVKMSLFQAKQILIEYVGTPSTTSKRSPSEKKLPLPFKLTPSPSEYRRTQKNPFKK